MPAIPLKTSHPSDRYFASRTARNIEPMQIKYFRMGLAFATLTFWKFAS